MREAISTIKEIAKRAGVSIGTVDRVLPLGNVPILNSAMAHGYSRGTWTAVEGAAIDSSTFAPYCTCAQLTVPALTKWMFVFEEPDEPVIWLAKATPAAWLENGQRISVKNAPTRFGPVSFELSSEIGRGLVKETISLPQDGSAATAKLRIRVPDNRKMKRVRVNGRTWKQFDPALDVITLPPSLKGQVALEVTY